MKLNGDKKRFALLLAAKDTEYVKKRYGGYFNVFVAAFGEEGENWDLFRVVEGEFPETEDLEYYDGFVISGSPYEAYGNDSWILKLCLLLQTLDSMRKKVLGICFGHQVICKALGGKVGKACSGWDLGIRKVKMVDDLMALNDNKNSKRLYLEEDWEEMPSSVSIIECHQDEVWEVPLGAQVIAYSDKTWVEMFSIGDHIFGIQGHPEYTNDILHNIIDRLLNDHSIQIDLAERAKIVAKTEDPDRKYLEKMCRNFLKNKKLAN